VFSMRPRPVFFVALLIALLIAGCGSSGGSSSTPTTKTPAVSKDAKVASEVPAAVKKKATLTVAADATYPPNEFIKPGTKTVIGMDADLAAAMSKVMGLKARVVNATFDSIIPGLAAKKYDIGMSSFTDTKEREKTVDFVTYFSAGSLWAKPKGSDIGPDNACGKKVAVQSTTTQEVDELPARSKTCTDAGKPAIEILKFDGQDQATNAVVLGQADAMSADSPVTLYAIKQSDGKLEQSGETFDSAPYGWPVKKGSALAASLQKALEHLIETGDYKTIATNWGVEAGLIDKPVINGATS
jgi:polar amino acid transport system substrate-binding protein